MTRTNKWTVHEHKAEPKWFTKNGNSLEDPTKIKKDGAGKFNWGNSDEIIKEYMFSYLARRNSNHETNMSRFNAIEQKVDISLLSLV